MRLDVPHGLRRKRGTFLSETNPMLMDLMNRAREATICSLGLVFSALALAQTDGAQRWAFTTLSTTLRAISRVTVKAAVRSS